MSALCVDLVRPAVSRPRRTEPFSTTPPGPRYPRPVIEAVAAALGGAANNLGGNFAASRRAGAIYDRAHDAVADLLGAASGREIVIGQSMTMLTFQLSRSLGRGAEGRRRDHRHAHGPRGQHLAIGCASPRNAD